MMKEPTVNPNYGGEDEPHPHNDPEVNPNYGGEDRNIHVEHPLDKPVDPVEQ